jgi:ABC-type phosphate/phosphonate transport system ATPase subunit/GNAT superfamily N-acetyltransferase
MPTSHIVRSSEINSSFRVEQIKGMFDVPNKTHITHEWDVNLPIESIDWQIGLIVGMSGSGKTTIAQELFKDSYIHSGYKWSDKSIIDDFPEDVQTKDIVNSLSSVGLSSPTHWIKRYSHLSNGQKFRCELARVLHEKSHIVVFDEFTSVVDRDVAKICSATIAKTIRLKKAPRLVAVSCHYDIIDWLNPDWNYDVNTCRFEQRTDRRRPEITLRVYETNTTAWQLFKGYHYLSSDINKAARCFCATWNNKPVAFCAVLHMPHPKCSTFKREHRTVVLPDYQGFGIGNKLSEFVAEHYTKKGFRFISSTSHPSMINHRKKSKLWKVTSDFTHKAAHTNKNCGTPSTKRVTASFEYILN